MDFGRITLAEDLVLYLFGTPGQQRFWFMWDDLCLGAIGAIVLVDTDRLDEAFSPLDYFESKGMPFIVAVNQFEGTHAVPDRRRGRRTRAVPGRPDHPHRRAATVSPCKQALVRVTEYALMRLSPDMAVPAG